MSELEARLKRLEENFGLGGDLNERAEKAGNHLKLMAYREGDCPKRFIPQVESLIARYGSLESAIKVCGEVDYRDIERAITKEEKQELGRIRKSLGLVVE